jgi:hypothetical protein
MSGYFTTYNGVSRVRIAAVDAVTGALDVGFLPGTGFDSTTETLLYNGGKLYVGGYFTSYNGTPRSRIAVLNGVTAANDPTFNPGTGVDSLISSFAISGTKLYIAGFFSNYNGTARTNVAAVDATTGAIDLGFNAGSAGQVESAAIVGTRLYLGGPFSTFNGSSVGGLVAVNTTTGALDGTFAVGNGFDNSVESVAATASGLMVGGWFSTFQGRTSRGVVALDAITGEDTGFTSGLPAFASVQALAISGNRLYVGGSFATYSGSPRSNIVAVDATTGALDAGFVVGAGTNSTVTSLAINGTRLYLGGYFTTYAAASRPGIAAVDSTTGTVDAGFVPGTGASGVLDITTSGSLVYLTGSFTTYNATPRAHLAAVNATSGALDPTFNPGTGLDADGEAIVVGGGRVYVGGSFTTYNGTARSRVVAVDATTAAIDVGFAPAGGANGTVYGLHYDAARLWVVGFITAWNGTARQRVAAVNSTTGALDATWSPGFGMDYNPADVTGSGSMVYIGGDFRGFNHVAQQGVVILDTCDRTTYCADEELRGYITMSAPATVTVPLATPATSSVVSLPVTVQTNVDRGYVLTATDTSDTTALTCSAGGCTGMTIADWTGTPAAPTTWAEAGANYGFGITVLTNGHTSKLAKWGTGTLDTDFVNNNYTGLRSGTSTVIHSTSRFWAGTPDITTMSLRFRPPAGQTSGSYTGVITLTAVGNP